MIMTAQTDEFAADRKHARYDPQESDMRLSLNVARSGLAGFLRLNPTASCLDFSLSGLQFGSDQRFKIDEALRIDLRVNDVEVREVNAVVVGCEEK
jgi:hypothetical protein